MIDFTKYNLHELRAIGAVMDDLMRVYAELENWRFALYVRSTAREVFRAESAAIDQQARDYAAAEAEKVNRIKDACIAGAPPTEAPAPDMFGWVGDAYDGLEVKLSD